MNKTILSLAVVFASFGTSFGASVKWQPSYDAALSLASKSHRLLMVDFYTDWCGWCKKLDSDTYDTPLIAGKAEGFVPVKINAEKEGVAQARKYHVTGFPTILFLKPNGDVAWKIVGYMPPEDFAKQMDLAQGVTTEFPLLKAAYVKYKLDPKVDSKLITYYSGLDDLASVTQVYGSLQKCPPTADKVTLAAGFNAAGDAFQSSGKNEAAEAAFKRAEEIGSPSQIVYARISLAECYLATANKANATAVLKSLLAMGSEADLYRKQAQAMLDSIQKS